jgi:nitrogen fixation protein FixH
MRRADDTAGFTLTGYHITAIFFAFFGVIIAVNLFMARAAVTNWTGLVVKNSYVASQQFNEKIKAHDSIAARGWREDVRKVGATLVWAINDASGETIATNVLTVRFTRPIGEKDDATVTVGPDANGRFAPIPFPAAGRWVVTISADIEGVDDFESIHRFDVPQDQ